MQRAQYASRGPVPQAVIAAVDFTLPALSTGQALIQVLAAPINPSDVLTLTGAYGMLPALPAVGGNEGVGRIVARAADVAASKLGQLVLLPVGCGSWSSHLIADASKLIRLPEGADVEQLAMLTVNPPTAALLLSEFVDLKPGDWVIQNAANSAVAGYLRQLAHSRGLHTVNIVRRESAVAAIAGGEVVLVDGDSLAKRVAAATGGARIRLGIDAVGGQATDRLATALGEGATLVNYGAMSGEPCVISPASFVFRDITLRGFWLAQWFRRAAVERQQQIFGELAGLVASGQLSARIQSRFPIEQIQQAVAAAAAGERDGKILIVPKG